MGLERDEHLHLRLFSVLVALEDICFRDTTLNVTTWRKLRLILEEVKMIIYAEDTTSVSDFAPLDAGCSMPACSSTHASMRVCHCRSRSSGRAR